LRFNRIGFLTEIDLMAYGDAGIIAGYCFKVTDWLYIGFNLKYVMRIMIAKDNIGLSTIIQFLDDSNGDGEIDFDNFDILNFLNNMGIVKTGHGVGSDIGFMFAFLNMKIGITITDWWGGTTINYFKTNVYRPLESTDANPYDPALKGVIPTAINVGFSAKWEKTFLPSWVLSDFLIAIDIRELFVFKFVDGEPSYDKTFFRNLYFGVEFKLFDIPGIRNIFMLPLRIGFGFNQGNISFAISGKLLWLFDITLAIWGEEKGDRVGTNRVYNFALMVEFGF
jgi:hypothetical protein